MRRRESGTPDKDQGIADLELHEDHVYLARVEPDGTIGPAVEQPLVRTAYKNVQHAVFGLSVFQHRAFTTRLPAGEYVSTAVSTHPDLDPIRATSGSWSCRADGRWPLAR